MSKLHGVAYKGELKDFYLKFIYNILMYKATKRNNCLVFT